jgi:hypothetical protein
VEADGAADMPHRAAADAGRIALPQIAGLGEGARPSRAHAPTLRNSPKISLAPGALFTR